jgi:hypothetical protein
MFARVVDDHGSVANGAIEQLMSGHGRRGGAEVGAADYHFVVWMAGGERFDLFDQGLGIVRRGAQIGSRKIDAMQHHRAEPHVRVGIGNAGNRRSAVQVDHLRLSLASRQDFLVAADGFDPRTADGKRLRPGGFGVSGVDMAVNQELVGGKKPRWYKHQHEGGTNSHKRSAGVHSVTVETWTTTIARRWIKVAPMLVVNLELRCTCDRR